MVRTINTFKQINSRIRRQKTKKTGTDDEAGEDSGGGLCGPRRTDIKAVSSYLKPLKAQMAGLIQNFTQQLQTGSEEQNGGKKVNRRERKGMQVKANYLQPLQKVFPVSYKAQYGFLI